MIIYVLSYELTVQLFALENKLIARMIDAWPDLSQPSSEMIKFCSYASQKHSTTNDWSGVYNEVEFIQKFNHFDRNVESLDSDYYFIFITNNQHLIDLLNRKGQLNLFDGQTTA